MMHFSTRELKWAEIDLNIIRNNLLEIKANLRKKVKLIAVVKGDGYGHGIKRIAPTVLAAGADMLAAGNLEEAIGLRETGISAPILLLTYILPSQAHYVLKYKITPMVCDTELARSLSKAALRLGTRCKIHVKVDTGLGRIGCLPKDVPKLIKTISNFPCIEIEGIYTHLATAHTGDLSYANLQINRFLRVVRVLKREGININLKHVANSATLLNLPQFQFDAVRCGSLIHGFYPSDKTDKRIHVSLAFALKTKIVYIKKVPANTFIGYGKNYLTRKPTIVATLPIGLYDGLGTKLKKKAYVLVKNRRAPIIGSICGDISTIDVTDIPQVKIGNEVVIIGKQGDLTLSIKEIAEAFGKGIGEFLVGIKRVPRIYLDRKGGIDPLS